MRADYEDVIGFLSIAILGLLALGVALLGGSFAVYTITHTEQMFGPDQCKEAK